MRSGSRAATGLGTLLVGLTSAMALCAPAQAVTNTYIFTIGSTPKWSDPQNWQNGLVPPQTPAPGDRSVVRINNAGTSNMDISDLEIDGLEFLTKDHTLTGSQLTIRGGDAIPNSCDGTICAYSNGGGGTGPPDVGRKNNKLALDLNVKGAVTVRSPNELLTWSGQTTVQAGATLSFFGNKGLTYQNDITYGSKITGSLGGPGKKVVGSGRLLLAKTSSAGGVTAGSVGAGGVLVGAAPVLQLDDDEQIANNAGAFADAGGILNLNGQPETVSDLSVQGGTVNGTSTSLKVLGTTRMNGGAINGGTLDFGPTEMTGGAIDGTSLALKGDVNATSTSTSPAKIDLPVSLNGARKFTVSNGPQDEDLQLPKTITDGTLVPSSVTKAGAGTLVPSASNNAWTGATTIAEGALLVPNTVGNPIPQNSPITIGDGQGSDSSARLKVGGSGALYTFSSVTVGADGIFDTNGFTTSIGPLAMTGGLIGGGGTLSPTSVTATSSAAGPARITTDLGVRGIPSDLEVSVSPGTGPELTVSGSVKNQSSTDGLKKTGAGTMLMSGTSTFVGPTEVAEGRLEVTGALPSDRAVSVKPGATLGGSGTVGDTTVSGTLAPAAPQFSTDDLTFTSTGKLAVSGPPSAGLPRVKPHGQTTIQPGATLNAALAATPTPPAGTILTLIANDYTEPILGEFANATQGSAITGASGQAFTAGYGRDFVLTAQAPPAAPANTTGGQPSSSTPASRPVTPSASTPRDTTKPKLKLGKLAAKTTLAKFLKGTTASITPSEAGTVKCTLATTARKPKTLATVTRKGAKAGKATRCTLKPSKKNLGRPKKAFKVKLSIAATDAAGNKGTASKTITVKP